jgi:outer membrane protein insertion porin family
LAEYSTYYAFGGKGKAGHQFVFARSTSIGLEQPFKGTRVLPPGSCPLNSADEPTCTDIATIPLPEQFFAGGGNSHRGFGLNQAGPRDPNSGFPVGGTAQFVITWNSAFLRHLCHTWERGLVLPFFTIWATFSPRRTTC